MTSNGKEIWLRRTDAIIAYTLLRLVFRINFFNTVRASTKQVAVNVRGVVMETRRALACDMQKGRI